MKVNCLIILLNFCLGFLQAEGANTNRINIANPHGFAPYIHYSVKSTNGLIMGLVSFEDALHTNVTEIESPICLSFSLPSQVKTVYIPKNEYLGQFSLYDTNNNLVSKTKLGENYKLKGDLHWDRKLVRQTGNGTTIPWEAQDGWSHLLELPKPSQLFEIKKPGKYRLVMQIQVFLKTGTNKDVVRFPPVEISVIQPDNIPLPDLPPNAQQILQPND
jgi:hypothetical protein